MIELVAGERATGESAKAMQAFNDYARMGAGRSLRRLWERYAGQAANEDGVEQPPSKSQTTIEGWSTKYGWQGRAGGYDAAVDSAKTAEAEQLRTEGLAADYERINELSTLYAALKNEFRGGAGLWFKDIKMSAKGETVEVDVFNKALVDSMRGTLDDIAKEVGGRKVKHEHTGKDGDPMELSISANDEINARIDSVRARLAAAADAGRDSADGSSANSAPV